MKTIIISLLVIIGIAVGVYFIGLKRTSEPYSEALKQEQAGNFPLAMSHNISVLMSLADARPLPSKSLGMTSPQETWIKELNGYIHWLLSPTPPSKRLPAVADAIDRVGKYVENQNAFVDMSVKRATIEEYQNKWNDIFYPAGKVPPAGQQSLLEKAMDASISILTLIGNPNYRYDGKAVNRSTGKCLDFTVYNEGQFSLLIPQGNYYLIVTSKATFQRGQNWESPANIISLTVPDSLSLIAGKLVTDIKRRK